MRKMVRKWKRRTTITVMKDDRDDNNSRVPDKTDILYHRYCNIVYSKNHKKKKIQSSASYYSDLLRHCVFVNESEEKEVREFFRYLFRGMSTRRALTITCTIKIIDIFGMMYYHFSR